MESAASLEAGRELNLAKDSDTTVTPFPRTQTYNALKQKAVDK